MQKLVKQLMDRDLSRRDFASALLAMGFTGSAVQSVLGNVAYAEATPPGRGVPFTGSGGEVLAECLKAAGVEYVFDVNSTGQVSFYDALSSRPELKLIIAVQEGQGVAMAQGYELVSGKTAVIFLPSVGIPNALSNLYNAWKDRSAIAVLSDGGNSVNDGRDGFQQVDDWLEPTEQFTKWRWQIDTPERIGELLRRVIKLAGTAPGGPVYLRMPVNVLSAEKVTQTIYPQSLFDVPLTMAPNAALIEQTARLLIEAKYPLISAGGEVTRARAGDDLVELADLLGIPVAQGFSVFQDFPTANPLHVGNYAMGFPRGLRNTDLFLNLGGMMPNPTIFAPPIPKDARIVHARVEFDNIGDSEPTDVAIAAGMKETIRALIDSVKSMATNERLAALRLPRMEQAQKDHAAAVERRKAQAQAKWDSSPLSTERLSYELDQALDPDAIVIGETGDYIPEAWIAGRQGGRFIIRQTTGFALGWSAPCAMGAKIAQPDRQVVALVGDGAFLFGQIESLWTAARYEIPITVIVFNNKSYDNERNRIMLASRLARSNKAAWKDMASYLGNPDVDYVSLAKGFRIGGERVEKPSGIKKALANAAAANREGRPYLIDAVMARRGLGAESTWHPDISIARIRTKKV